MPFVGWISKYLPRFIYMRINCYNKFFFYYYIIKNAQLMATSVRKETRPKRTKSIAYKRSPSHDSDAEAGTRWTRGTWFPNSNPNSPIIILSDILLCYSFIWELYWFRLYPFTAVLNSLFVWSRHLIWGICKWIEKVSLHEGVAGDGSPCIYWAE